MVTKRVTNPENLPVQLNVKVPFWLREVLIAEARDNDSSQSEIVKEALETRLGSRILEDARARTKRAGATS